MASVKPTRNDGKQLDAGEGNEGAVPKQLTPEQLEKLGRARQHLATTFAQVSMALMMTPRYRNLFLRELEDFVLQPLIHDRIAVAMPKMPEGAEDQPGLQPLVGIAIWARVSDDVSERIREQIKAGTFPVRLKASDWNSGDIVWLLDVIAPSKPLAAAVLGSFGRIANKSEVFIHPVAAGQVDKELLDKLKAAKG